MKIILTIILFVVSFCTSAQDTIGMKKKNFFVFNANYLYNQYIGSNHFERQSGPSSSSIDTSYYHTTAENTSGLIFSPAYRHRFDNYFFVQVGIGFRNITESYLHNDSVVNENKSPIIRHKQIDNKIESPIYFGLRLKRLVLMSGFVLPLYTYGHYKSNFEDGTISTSTTSLRQKGNFFSYTRNILISEKLQLNIFQKQNIGISIGADFSPEIIGKYRRGYLINWNAGIIWMIEKKERVKVVDYTI